MSVRLAVAGQPIANDELLAKISRFETSDLDERHKAALRYADAHMMVPREIDARLHEHFAPAQIVQLMLNVSAWSRQKIAVALGVDDALPEPERLREVGPRFEGL